MERRKMFVKLIAAGIVGMEISVAGTRFSLRDDFEIFSEQ